MKDSPSIHRLAIIIPCMMFFAGLLAIFFIVESAAAQPPIPHTLVDRDDCFSCHASESSIGIPQMPDEHDWQTSNSCKLCHDPLALFAPSVPHTLEGRDDCLGCHLSETAMAEFLAESRAQSEPVPTPMAFADLESEEDSCVGCHLSAVEGSEHIVTEWQSSIHAERGILCVACHGGNPNAQDMNAAKAIDAGYIGKPDRTSIPELCGSCHADVTQMRQYDLPTDQLAKYRESFHGQQLENGDTKVATCFDCHDGHATHESTDPAASVYHMNVPELCAGCHADGDYMAEYDIATNQYELYASSVHGIALLEQQDIRAPNCATCHGTHGAAPPGYAEVSNVCGSCHSATQDYYVSGPHNSDNPESPRCVTCHGRYDVEDASEAMFLGDEPRHCGSCHAPDSETGTTVAAIYEMIIEADRTYAEAEETIERAKALGMLVTEEENLLAEAFTKLVIAQAAQHTVTLETVEEQSAASTELSSTALQQAEDAIGESQFRRRAMIVALVIITVVIFSLVLLRRELHIRQASKNTG
jgi:hypothetical protein